MLEVNLESVSLLDRRDGPALVVRGGYTGAILLNDYPLEQVAFEAGATEEVIITEPFQQVW